MTHVLSDQEINEVAFTTPGHGEARCGCEICNNIRRIARAVEAKVLEKLRPDVAIWFDLERQREAEARRREREACQKGIAQTLELTRREMMYRAGNSPDAIVDRLFPLPAPEPREVVGKNGTRYRRWKESDRDAILQRAVVEFGAVGPFPTDWERCTTIPVEDAEAVASLLKP